MENITTNQLAQWMMEQGLSTGHGESIEALLGELSDQLKDLRRAASQLDV